MRNFPRGLRSGLKRYFDAKGTLLSERVTALSQAVDVIWEHPLWPAAVKRFNLRLSKLLRGINYNHLFLQRFEVSAEYVRPFDARREKDERQCIVLDAEDAGASLEAVAPMFSREPETDEKGLIVRGMGALCLNFLSLALFRKAVACWREGKPKEFPSEVCEKVAALLGECGDVWCPQTALPERQHVVEVVAAAYGATPDKKEDVVKASKLLGSLKLAKLVPADVVARVRMCELYHEVWPFVTGKRNLREELSSHRETIKRDMERLMDDVLRVGDGSIPEPETSVAIRRKVEARLARGIGMNKGDLGWQIYRGLRRGEGRVRRRSEYIFKSLLQNSRDRLAVVNTIYR